MISSALSKNRVKSLDIKAKWVKVDNSKSWKTGEKHIKLHENLSKKMLHNNIAKMTQPWSKMLPKSTKDHFM